MITPGAITTGSIDTSNTSDLSLAANLTLGGGGEVTLVAGSSFKSKSGITVQGGINSSSNVSYSCDAVKAYGVPQGDGAATITLIALNAGSDITVVNPDGPAVAATAPGTCSGSGALVVETPGEIDLENNSSTSTNVVDTSGSSTSYGAQVFLASGKTTGQAVTLLAKGVAGNIYNPGHPSADVWLLTAGGSYTPYTVIGGNQYSFTDLDASKPIGPGTNLTITFQPGSSPKGYCPGGYTAISDTSGRPTQITIVDNGDSQQLEVPILVTGSAGIRLTNKKSFIEGTYINGPAGSAASYPMKLYSAGQIVAPVGNATPKQALGLTNAISTTGNIAISFVSSPINLFNTTATPSTLSLSTLPLSTSSLSSTPGITSYGQMVAGKSITIKTAKGSNGGFSLSTATWWECFDIANAISISVDGAGSITGDGEIYSHDIALKSGFGDISGASGPDFGINAALVQFNTAGAVDINDGWPAVLKHPTGNPILFGSEFTLY